MAELTGKAISELPAATTIGNSDLLAISQNGASKKITPPVLLSVVEGEISGLSGSLATYVRPNLLDNWLLAGLGSQNSNYSFPINQRGQTTYAAAGYFIDRWRRTTTGSASIQLTANGLLTTGTDPLYCRQSNKIKTQLIGKTLTYSILYKNAGLKSVTHVLTSPGRFATSADTIPLPIFAASDGSITNELVEFKVISNDHVVAVKLEIGNTSTLAHLENGVWVLNELPDYETELVKCERYFVHYDEYDAFGWTAFNSKQYVMIVHPPVSMNSAPSVTLEKYGARIMGGFSVLTGDGTVTPESIELARSATNENNVYFSDVRAASGGDTNATFIFYRLYNLNLSCEP